ncbi:hypothetical protein [Moorena sp. SIO4G3]|nr:hypothetical protein [Moorena sp. SIO4G3]
MNKKFALFPCLDAVAHGGNPQDRAASLLTSLKAKVIPSVDS